MGIGRKIREARTELHLTQEELALKLGVTKSAVANYENDTSYPKGAVLCQLFRFLHVDANYLFSDALSEVSGTQENVLTLKEAAHLRKYRRLSDYARETVDYLLEREFQASAHFAEDKEEKKDAPFTAAFSAAPAVKPSAVYQLYPYLQMAASAGTGAYAADMPQEEIEAPRLPHADFIIGVSGASMEPLYYSGDRLYVQKTDRLSLGEIGIFSKDSELFVKKAGRDRLLSLNPDFPDILPEEGSIEVIGRVLGRVE